MIWSSENNWYKWQYDDGEFFGRRSSPLEKFKVIYTKYKGKYGSFQEEMKKACSSILDHYPGLRPCVFFSGGVDSEIILRTFIDIGANPLVYTVRYENDINIYDVSYAVVVSNLLGIKLNIIDFNLKKFFENDAVSVYEQGQQGRPRMLAQMKFGDFAEGLPIVGMCDMRWFRDDNNYSRRGIWLLEDFEHEIALDKYNYYRSRPAVYQFFKWSPSLVLSYTKMEWFKKLITDQYPGKLGIDSTKILGYREGYPMLIDRKKKTGFELIQPLITEFESYLITRHGYLPYRQSHMRNLDQLWIDITDNKYPEILEYK
jgi:hypothetical protein